MLCLNTKNDSQMPDLLRLIVYLGWKMWLYLISSRRDGNDSRWSTFFLGIGTPPQYVRVLVSTTIVQPWAVLPQGCTPQDPSNCASTRGELYVINESTTWHDEGLFTLQYEQNLGFYGNGGFGLDNLTLGLPGTDSPNLGGQVVAGIVQKTFTLVTSA